MSYTEYIGINTIKSIIYTDFDIIPLLPRAKFFQTSSGKPLLWKTSEVIEALQLDPKATYKALENIPELERFK